MNPYVIVDVRSAQEFATGHLTGAINIPHDQIAQRIDSLDGVDRSSQLLVYCRSGARSAIACSVLAQHGFKRAVNGGSMTTLLMQIKGTISDVSIGQ